jgi:hypothetical protein
MFTRFYALRHENVNGSKRVKKKPNPVSGRNCYCGANAALVKLKVIVRVLLHTLTNVKKLRLAYAAVFAFVLFAEWSSHGVILSDRSEVGGQAISSSDRGHEDPCRTLVCSEGQRKDQGLRFSHDASQHNAFFQPLSKIEQRLGAPADRLSHGSLILGISRPPDPAFHPPEIS